MYTYAYIVIRSVNILRMANIKVSDHKKLNLPSDGSRRDRYHGVDESLAWKLVFES